MALFDSFIIQPGDNPADPNSIIRRRKMAEELMKQGMDGSPIRSPWQGVNRVAQALTGAYDERIADQQEGANNKWNSEALASLLGGGSSGSAPAAAAPAPAPASGGGTVAPEDLAPLIQKASAQTGIPVPVLTAQIKQESGFNPNAVGKAGEIGLMQIMPSTAKQPGFGMQGIDPAALRDPETNIMFGANYLKARGGKVDYNDQSNVAKALAAYNGGGDPNYVQNVTRFMPGQGGQQQPVQVAQNGPASGLMGLGGGGQAQGGPNPNDLLRIIADPRASAGLKQAAQAKLQMMQKDPLQDVTIAEKQANIAKTRAELGNMDKTGDIKEYQLAVQQGEQRPFTEWLKDVKRSGATNINTGPGPTKNVYETVEKRADEARAAAQSLPAFAEAKRLVESGNITLGAGADTRVAMQKLGALFGLDTTSASNAETFRAAMAPTVLGLVKGLGAGSGISNADRDFAERAAGGNINLEPATIKRLIDIGVRASQAKIDAHNKMVDQVYPEADTNNGQVRSLFRVSPEAFSQPQLAPAAAPAPAGAQAPQAGQTGPRQAPDGKWYVPDPNRPGKYLRVEGM
jgi:hypothetical protein